MNSTTRLIASIVILLVVLVSLGAIAVTTIGSINPILGIVVVSLLIMGGLYIMPWILGGVPLEDYSEEEDEGSEVS